MNMQKTTIQLNVVEDAFRCSAQETYLPILDSSKRASFTTITASETQGIWLTRCGRKLPHTAFHLLLSSSQRLGVLVGLLCFDSSVQFVLKKLYGIKVCRLGRPGLWIEFCIPFRMLLIFLAWLFRCVLDRCLLRYEELSSQPFEVMLIELAMDLVQITNFLTSRATSHLPLLLHSHSPHHLGTQMYTVQTIDNYGFKEVNSNLNSAVQPIRKLSETDFLCAVFTCIIP